MIISKERLKKLLYEKFDELLLFQRENIDNMISEE